MSQIDTSSPFLPLPDGIVIASIHAEASRVIVSIACTLPIARCPLCGQPSERIHGDYVRTVADLPCGGRRVILKLSVRKFVCGTPTCPRRIFTERLPDLVQSYARMTNRLSEALQALGFATCGEVGERLAPQLGMQVSGPTLLRRMRTRSCPVPSSVRILGIDDWCWKKGLTYGTILVDLESRKPIELLPDRTAETVEAWLRTHPEVEIVSRDRGGDYAAAARKGAPQAQQVADRFHLLKNLRERLKEVMDRKQSCLPEVEEHASDAIPAKAQGIRGTDAHQLTESQAALASEKHYRAGSPYPNQRPEGMRYDELQKQVRRDKRVARYQDVQALLEQGFSQRAIARKLKLARATVRKFAQAEAYPEMHHPKRGERRSLLDPYKLYILQRWQQGCTNGAQLYNEINVRGFTGSAALLRMFLAEVLAAHLLAEQPDQVSTLHRRASEWYERHGSAGDAIRHALTAEDFERAADLVELAIPEMRRSRQDATLLGWLKALPDELFHFRPVLSVGYAYALLADGGLEASHARLRDAERWLDTTTDTRAFALAPSAGMIVVDEEEFRRLPALIAVYRAAHAQALGDVPDTIKYARQVLDLVPEEDHLGRGAAAALLGLASWVSGDLEAAHQTFADGIASVQMAGNISDAISGTIALADIRIAQGRLHEAMRTYERSLQEALELGEPVLRGTADLYVGMSELHREQNDLDVATQHLLKSKERGERTGFPQNRSRWCVALARIREAQGDLDGALDLLHEAELLYVRDFFPNVRPVAALVTRMWVAQGRLGEALSWAREQGLSVEGDLSYLREFEHITLARVLLARSKSDRADRSLLEAMGLLSRLLKAAQEGERTGSVIEILAMQALAHQTQGDIPAALMSLRQALTLAEPEGYVRMFVDEGPPMAALLQEAAKHGITPNYVRQLLTATGSAEDRTPVKQVLIEPLSERELEVLRLLGTGLNGPEMARELVVSLNTVRTHTKNIYSKLGVNNRRAAVRRAEELDLL